MGSISESLSAVFCWKQCAWHFFVSAGVVNCLVKAYSVEFQEKHDDFVFYLHFASNLFIKQYLILSCWFSCLYYFTYMNHGDKGGYGKQVLVLSIWEHFILFGSLTWLICLPRLLGPFHRHNVWNCIGILLSSLGNSYVYCLSFISTCDLPNWTSLWSGLIPSMDPLIC